MFGGGVGLYCALGIAQSVDGDRHGVGACALRHVLRHHDFLQGNYGAAALVTVAMYGFATAAMLIPALYEFDVATGRTTAKDHVTAAKSAEWPLRVSSAVLARIRHLLRRHGAC